MLLGKKKQSCCRYTFNYQHNTQPLLLRWQLFWETLRLNPVATLRKHFPAYHILIKKPPNQKNKTQLIMPTGIINWVLITFGKL